IDNILISVLLFPGIGQLVQFQITGRTPSRRLEFTTKNPVFCIDRTTRITLNLNKLVSYLCVTVVKVADSLLHPGLLLSTIGEVQGQCPTWRRTCTVVASISACKNYCSCAYNGRTNNSRATNQERTSCTRLCLWCWWWIWL